MSHRYLDRLHAELSSHRAVISIDLPGFGGLPKPRTDVDVDEMGRTLAHAIERLDLGPVVLFGHSMGTQWVVEAARRRPDLVEHLVIMGPVADERYRSVLAQSRALALDTLGEPPRVNATVFADYLRCGIPWYLTQLRHMIAYPIEDRIADLSVPLLIIRGERDPIAGLEWSRMLRERHPTARLVMIPGHHHNAQQSAPRAVAAALLANVG